MDGIWLDAFRLDMVYDVTPALGAYLVADGFAIFENRDSEHVTRRTPERRKRPGKR